MKYRFHDEMPTSRASILAPEDSGGGAYSLYLSDPIDSWGGYWGVSAKEFGEALAELPEDAKEIRLYINSPGGEVWDGIAMINMLRRHQARVVAHVDGIAASMASVIAITADETVMGVGAQMMIHDSWSIVVGDESDMLAMAARLSKDSDSLAALYAEKAGGTADEWRSAMRDETWYTAAEAVAAGLADRAITRDKAKVEARAVATIDRYGALFRYGGRATAPQPHIAAPKHSVSSEPEESNRKDSDMSDSLKAGICTRLGITDPGALDESAVFAALDEALAEQADPNPAPAGTVLVEQAVMDNLRADAALGRAAHDNMVSQRREQLVKAAIEDGRIAPARRDHWIAALAADEEGQGTVLASLAKGLVPVVEQGHANADQPDDAYPAHWKR